MLNNKINRKNKISKLALAMFVSLSVFGITSCSDKEAPKPVKAVVKAPVKTQEQIDKELIESVNLTVVKKHPDVTFDKEATRKIQIGSEIFFEVVTDTAVLYTNQSVDFVLFGNLFVGEGDKVTDITASAKKPVAQPEIHPQDVFDSMPFENGITKVFGNGSRKVIVFEDPDCGFCQAFRKDLKSADPDKLDLTVTFFPLIMQEVHPNAVMRAKALSCAADPAKAWDEWMAVAFGKNQDEEWAKWAPKNAANDGSCEAGQLVAVWQETASALGFEGTPTIMFEDGVTSEGRPAMTDFETSLVRASQSAQVRRQQLAEAEAAASAATPAEPQATLPSEEPVSATQDKPTPSAYVSAPGQATPTANPATQKPAKK